MRRSASPKAISASAASAAIQSGKPVKGSTPEPVDAITPRTPPAGADPPEAVTPRTPPAVEEAWSFELFAAAELPLAVEAEDV